jgi:hypothetical protein
VHFNIDENDLHKKTSKPMWNDCAVFQFIFDVPDNLRIKTNIIAIPIQPVEINFSYVENPEQTSTLFRSMPAPHSAGSQHPIPEQASR